MSRPWPAVTSACADCQSGSVLHCAAMNTTRLPSAHDLQLAVEALKAGGIIAYPTEAVWGLGCDPFNEQAVCSLLDLKQRPGHKGLIIIAASIAQIEPWLAGVSASKKPALLATWPGPYTWIVPAPDAPQWLRGEHAGLAVRVSAHEGVRALCEAWGGPLVSTSANLSGQAPVQDVAELEQQFGAGLAAIVPGALGGDARPSEIRDAETGVVLRPR